MKAVDKIIIGAGLYGLYSALHCAQKGERIIVLEHDADAFSRATYINQARVHMGYHYPRSYTTAIKSAGYFNRFNSDYGFCIHDKFEQVYATSTRFSWTDAEKFKKFCSAANIRCEEVSPNRYFKTGLCDGAFLTEEYTYDAQLLKRYFLEKLAEFSNCCIFFNTNIQTIQKGSETYEIVVNHSGEVDTLSAPYVLNASYASVNQILNLAGFQTFKVKYEICEIILCQVNDALRQTGLTVMDGPFFSIMPFGKTGLHSLTSVTFTPHTDCKTELPQFTCQAHSKGYCSPQQLGNCNFCPVKPDTAWPYMSNLARKYMLDDLTFHYEKSLFSMKPILQASEVDDSRPTVIRVFSESPYFVSVLSGKINTVYDLDPYLNL